MPPSAHQFGRGDSGFPSHPDLLRRQSIQGRIERPFIELATGRDASSGRTSFGVHSPRPYPDPWLVAWYTCRVEKDTSSRRLLGPANVGRP